jgi:fucose 4-O-acetylase-like acetyltransferase
MRGLAWLGRRALVIYLLHQPFFFAMFALAGLVGIGR